MYCYAQMKPSKEALIVYKIALCDDDISSLDALCAHLASYQQARQTRLAQTVFHSPLDLLAAIERGMRFDILFLDVLMPGENGIGAAAEIREHDKNVKIIFLTSSAEYALQSYTVGAFFYQLKPITPESFFRLMDSALAACEKEKTDSIVLRCKNGITRILLDQLEFCEVIHRTLIFHLTDGTVLESVGSLDELSSQLAPYGNFMRFHRSYLINLDSVRSLSARSLTMDSMTELPIPRGKYNEVKTRFLECAFEKRTAIP